MFKSKGFTVGFILLSLIIVALAGFLIYLLPKKSQSGTDFQGYSINQNDDNAPVSNAPTDAQTNGLRALTEEDHPIYPVIGQEIQEKGVLTVIESAENSGGIVFHKQPAFDAADTEGNVINYRGSFDIVKKIFILDKNKPYIMYETADGYYVTSNKNYVSYAANTRTIDANPEKVATYGYNSDSGLILTVYAEDGNHLAFSIFTYDGTGTGEVLDDVIAKYDAFGTAHFEYFANEKANDGTLTFSKKDGKISSVTVKFDTPITVNGKEISELQLGL